MAVTADPDEFSRNKRMPASMRTVILYALSYFPALKDTPIDFVFSSRIRNSVMLAQPRLSSLLGSRGRRSYVIRMNRRFRLGGERLQLETLPTDVLIGWIGHELGHIMDYLPRSTVDMIRFGIGYSFSRKYIMAAERAADTYAVQQGLAGKIITTKNFILDHASIPPRYKQKIRRLYLSPDDIMELVATAEAAAEAPASGST
jgi:hypothetical protein